MDGFIEKYGRLFTDVAVSLFDCEGTVVPGCIAAESVADLQAVVVNKINISISHTVFLP